jgi:cellulose synthase/poly-beta-1,6-N-acetylglucosamine synthase-like glycosyltransferase
VGRGERFTAALLPLGKALPRFRRLGEDELRAAIENLAPEDVDLALRRRLIPIARQGSEIVYAAGSPASLAFAEASGFEVAALANRHRTLALLQARFQSRLKHGASRRLLDSAPIYSAARRLTKAQRWFMLMALLLGVGFVAGFGAVAGVIIGCLCSLFFLMVIGLRLLSLGGPVAAEHLEPVKVPETELPEFTILVPLFREISVVRQVLDSVAAIDYPADRLDVKIVLEENDRETVDYVRDCILPQHFEVIVVPACKPQTKPKALNYALSFSRGDLIAVYDAEDVPDPRQLRLAAGVFAKAPADLACVQARLDFFNAGDNWLTRQFAIEYAVLFRRLLPVLASLSLPLPLGGTSNHFRADILRKVGGWDPHNVTEDADLGLRLARLGYRTGVIDSETSEEANCALGNWMQQRARWLKGWMQTWLVHMREPRRLLRELGCAGFMATQAWLAGLIFSSLVHPFFLAYTIWLMARGEFFPASADLIGTMVVGLNLAVLFAGYAVYVLVAWEALAKRDDRHLRPWLIYTPIYWLLISAAAWLALWQLLHNPFGWNKTRHGLVRRPRREG